MNKQELIKEFEEIGIHGLNMFGTVVKGIPTETAIKLIEQLDEPESGHADEAPRYLKNVLARLRELPLHNREVWLKVIMSEFKQDFSNAKWREGYEQGKLEGMVERKKVKVPQFVADVIEDAREQSVELEDAFEYVWEVATGELREWFRKLENRNNFARAWLDGYEVEEEKRYKVVMPNVSSSGGVLTRIKHDDSWIWIDTLGTIVEGRTHTRKELEEAGFRWVFDCEGIEIEEVE